MSKKGISLRAIIVVVVILLLVAGGAVWAAHAMGWWGKKAATLKTDVLTRGDVSNTVSDTGNLQAPTVVQLKSNVGGTIMDLEVDAGDHVKKGQLIAHIDPTDSITTLQQSNANLQSAQSQVKQATQGLELQKATDQANLESAQQALASANANLATAEEQARVQPDLTNNAVAVAQSNLDSAQSALTQMQSATIPQRLASAQASYDSAQAAVDNNQKQYVREQDLYAKSFVAQKDVEAAELALQTSQAQLDSAKKVLDTVKAETDADLANAKSQVAQAKLNLQTAEANKDQIQLKQLAVDAAKAQVQQAEANVKTAQANVYQEQMKAASIVQANASVVNNQAAVDDAKQNVVYTTITSPLDGLILAKYVEAGTIVSGSKSAVGGAGTTLFDIADTSELQVLVDVDETDIGKIVIGQPVEVTMDAYPDEKYAGKVDKIAPETVTAQNVVTVPVTVDVLNPKSHLEPGMDATCNFIIGEERKDVLRVPNEAVKSNDNGATNYLYVMKDGKPVVVPVTIGLPGDTYTEIVSGDVNEGDIVVTSTISTSKTSTPTPAGGIGGLLGGPMMRGR